MSRDIASPDVPATASPAAPAPARAEARAGRPPGAALRLLLSNETGLALLIVLFGALFWAVSPAFLSPFSLYAMSRTAGINIVIGFSMMVVIATGGLSLSVGAIGVAAAMAGGALMELAGWPWLPTVIGALGVGVALGAVNGALIVRSGLHSFIITLATTSIFFGTMIFLTRAESYRDVSPAFAALGRAKLGGTISWLLVLSALVALALAVLFRATALGRGVLATGANARAAELSGIRTDRAIGFAHALSGGLAAVAGLMLVARTGAAIPSAAGQLGQDWLLPAFLAPVLGGTPLAGGRVSVLGTFLGAFLVTMLGAGLLLMQVGAFWIQSWLGLLLLAAVLVDRARRGWLVRRKLA